MSSCGRAAVRVYAPVGNGALQRDRGSLGDRFPGRNRALSEQQALSQGQIWRRGSGCSDRRQTLRGRMPWRSRSGRLPLRWADGHGEKVRSLAAQCLGFGKSFRQQIHRSGFIDESSHSWKLRGRFCRSSRCPSAWISSQVSVQCGLSDRASIASSIDWWRASGDDRISSPIPRATRDAR